MSKDNKAVVLYRLQSVARLTRTVLAARLLEQGFMRGRMQSCCNLLPKMV